jgi:hypothetical protein
MTLTIYRADGYPKSARTQLVSIPRVTTLPASPFDGQEVYLVSASGALQHLRYYATGANWEYVGRAVQDEGSAVTVRNVLNFVGPNITTADDAANSRTNITTTVPVVSALPGSPVNGQECYYTFQQASYPTFNSTPMTWHLRYDASLAKWDVVGGAPLFAEVVGNEGTGAGAYVDLATGGPYFTLPLAGDYLVTVQGRTYNSNAGSGTLMSYQIGATAPVQDDGIDHFSSVAGTVANNLSHTRRKTLGAVVISCKYGVQAGGTGFWSNRVLTAQPLRVG